MREGEPMLHSEIEGGHSSPESGPESWRGRFEVLQRNSRENASYIVEQLRKGEPFSEKEKQELKHIQETLGVTIGCNLGGLQAFFTEGRYRPYYERAGRFEKLLSMYYRKRKQVEKELGIKPRDTDVDPELVYGAAVHDTERDNRSGGAPNYGHGVTLVLNPERIRDRTSFTYGDSFYAFGGKAVGWEDAAQLKLIREEQLMNYVEAQIAGGVTLDDVQEVRFRVASEERGEELLQRHDITALASRNKAISFSYVVDDFRTL